MKLLLMRHGESEDDLTNQYGGWTDLSLTDEGKKQIENKITEIKKINIDFDIILSSPLKRAKETAEILSEKLNIAVEILEYVKERNTYGLLSGMVKEEAGQKYPDQVKKLNKGDYVDGSERYEDLLARVKKSFEMIKNSGHSNVIVVSHGNYIKCFVEELMGKKLIKKSDGGFVLLDVEDGNFKIISEEGIEIE